MLRIDGTDGGGQVLRTALSLSVVTDTPFEMTNIRGARPNEGLRAQHLTAVDLVADLADADVEGAEPGSASLTFRPGSNRRTDLRVDVGTAGSVTLLFDTVLPIAAATADAIDVVATGGTDVKWAPTVAYLRRVKLPLLARFGFEASVDVAKTGFYPAGGGRATLRTRPSTLGALDIVDAGSIERVGVSSKAAASLANQQVAERQAARAEERLANRGFPVADPVVEYAETDSPGSSILVWGEYEHSVVGFDVLGERGRPSETVADDAVGRFEAFDADDAPVDPFMADQSMVFLALAGGRVRIPYVSDHVRTNLAVLSAFGSDLTLEEDDRGVTLHGSALATTD